MTREIRELGYIGAYTAVKRYLAAIRPQNGPKPYEVRFETPPGVQAQVDFARFVVDFADLHFGDFRPFLVFNVGDAAISIAVVILLLRAFLARKDQKEGPSPEETIEHA